MFANFSSVWLHEGEITRCILVLNYFDKYFTRQRLCEGRILTSKLLILREMLYLTVSFSERMRLRIKIKSFFTILCPYGEESVKNLLKLLEFCKSLYFILFNYIWSVIREKGESQNGCNKKVKDAKFSEKGTFLTPRYVRVRVCITGLEMFIFWKIWLALLSCYLRFEIQLFALLPTI